MGNEGKVYLIVIEMYWLFWLTTDTKSLHLVVCLIRYSLSPYGYTERCALHDLPAGHPVWLKTPYHPSSVKGGREDMHSMHKLAIPMLMPIALSLNAINDRVQINTRPENC